MNAEKLHTSHASLMQDNRYLRVVAVVLSMLTLALGFGLVFRKQIVVIVPSNDLTKSTYTATSADQGALSSWGLYVATLLGNVTPSNGDFVANELGHLLAPSIYKKVMSSISDQVAKIQQDQLTLQFSPSAVAFNKSKDEVSVDGCLTTTDSHGSQHRQELTYHIYFTVVNYQPHVVGLTTTDGGIVIGQ